MTSQVTAAGNVRRVGRVRTLSAVMATCCLGVALTLALAVPAYWVFTPTQSLLSHARLAGIAAHELSPAARLLGFTLSMAPLAVLIWGLLCARRCFNALAGGHYFSVEAVRGLRGFAVAILVSSLLKPLSTAALSVLLTWSNPIGARLLQFTLDSDTLLAFLFAGTLSAIAAIMAEAAAIAEENGQFI